MNRFYAAALSEPPKHATVGRLAQLAIEMESNQRVGILPISGGWHEQDPDHVFLIRLAANARGERQRIQQQKQSRSSKRRR